MDRKTAQRTPKRFYRVKARASFEVSIIVASTSNTDAILRGGDLLMKGTWLRAVNEALVDSAELTVDITGAEPLTFDDKPAPVEADDTTPNPAGRSWPAE